VDASAIIGIRWVHVFEEDTNDGAMYRPETGSVPLSRRPREALTLHPDGSATVEAGGADDRPTRRSATWTDTPAGIVVEGAPQGGRPSRVLTITRASTEYLIVS
jgi:hypothetical protein